MADEYINREAAIDRLKKLFLLQAATAKKIIEAIPAADAVPVVRCKYCVYYDTVGWSDGFGWCEGTMVNTSTHDNFFCAEGKKKENA